jgi:glucose/arabinose dehydrogenase
MRFHVLSTVAALASAAPLAANAQKPERTLIPATTFTSMPAVGTVDASIVRRLKAPAGFTVSVFARGLGSPRMMAVDGDGTVYVTRRDSGDVIALSDDGSGRAETPRVVVRNLPGVHGIALYGGRMYLATVKEVFVVNMRRDGTLSDPRPVVSDLPDGGQHPNRTIGIGPDGMLYVGVGSTCNLCVETNEENATLVRMKADGTDRGVFASGLRNTVGWAWHPETRELWGMDHGSDMKGNDVPPEELNKLQSAGNYGWPFCYGNRVPDETFAQEPAGSSKKELCPRTTAPVLTYQAHSAPVQMVFYNGRQFPSDFRGDAFVAMRGSWNRQSPTGYKIVRIVFDKGTPVRFDDFLTGFLSPDGNTQFGRLAGIAVAKDGALLVGDDENGVIYRVAFGSDERRASAGGEVALGPAIVDTIRAAEPLDTTPLARRRVVRADRVAFHDGFREPESAIYDADQDVYFVSNIEGRSAEKDGRGFISRVPAGDGVKETRWINSGVAGVTLNAPKGMAIVGDTLWVSDIDVVRAFNRKSGALISTVNLAGRGATFLNDIAVGGDGAIYITDSQIVFDARGNTTHRGTDRVFRIDKERDASIAIELDRLGRPNGIVWDKVRKTFVIVPMGSDTLWGWRGGPALELLGRGPGQFDGVNFSADSTLLVASKATSSIYSLRNGRLTPVIQNLPDVADIGLDTKRGLILVTLTSRNRVELYRSPETR